MERMGPLAAAPDLAEGMFPMIALNSTAPDPTAWPVEVYHLSVQVSTGDDLNPRQDYHVRLGAADWTRNRVTATSSDTSKLPTSRTTPRGIYSCRATTRTLSDDKCHCVSMGPSDGSRNQGRLSSLGSAEVGHLNLCPMASYYVLAAGRPQVNEGWPGWPAPGSALSSMATYALAAASPSLGSNEERRLNACQRSGASYYVLAAASPPAEDKSCPNLSTPGSNKRDLNLLASLGEGREAALAPAPTNRKSPSLTPPGSEAHSHCLRLLHPSTKSLSTPGSTDEGNLNLCPLAPSLSPPGPAEGNLNLCPLAPGLSSAPGSAEGNLNLCPLAMASYVQAAVSPLARDESPSISTLGSAARLHCLLHLSESTTYPVGSNASMAGLSRHWLHPPHRRVLHVSLVPIQEPRVRT